MSKLFFALMFLAGLALLLLTIFAEHGFIIGGVCP